MTPAFPAVAAQVPSGAAEEVRAGADEKNWLVVDLGMMAAARAHRPVEPGLAVDHLLGEDAAAADGAPAPGVAPAGDLLGRPRGLGGPGQAQPHAP